MLEDFLCDGTFHAVVNSKIWKNKGIYDGFAVYCLEDIYHYFNTM